MVHKASIILILSCSGKLFIKSLPEQDKIKIIEALWTIIYSNKDADIYETNLMRRLAGLLYIDNKTMGDIKEKIKQNLE